MDKYELTPEEKKNGWTPDTLREYHESRDDAFLKQEKEPSFPVYQNRRHPFQR
jgi:hypothetical protein